MSSDLTRRSLLFGGAATLAASAISYARIPGANDRISLGYHPADMVHHLLGDPAPTSGVAQGGVFVWPDGRENPDTFHALLEYPKGFLFSYSTSFGNDSDSFTRIMGDRATLLNIGGEGSQRWKLIEEKGTHEIKPFLRRSSCLVKLRSADRTAMSWSQRLLNRAVEKTYGPLPFTSDAYPSQPNASVDEGLAQSAAAILSARSQRDGRKLYWDRRAERIVEEAPRA